MPERGEVCMFDEGHQNIMKCQTPHDIGVEEEQGDV